MWTSTYIRRYIFSLPADRIFTTRECLIFGIRRSVDVTLHRLVKAGTIVRLARGVFMQDREAARSVHPMRILEAKAAAFGKRVLKHGLLVAQEIGLPTDGIRLPEYCTIDGHSTSLQVSTLKFPLLGLCPRRMKLPNSKAGNVINALWHIGRKRFNKELLRDATIKLNYSDRQELLTHISLMPAWLSDHIVRPQFPRNLLEQTAAGIQHKRLDN